MKEATDRPPPQTRLMRQSEPPDRADGRADRGDSGGCDTGGAENVGREVSTPLTPTFPFAGTFFRCEIKICQRKNPDMTNRVHQSGSGKSIAILNPGGLLWVISRDGGVV